MMDGWVSVEIWHGFLFSLFVVLMLGFNILRSQWMAVEAASPW
jgi:hypothetical protein